VEVSEFHDLYRKSPEIALNELRSKLYRAMKLIIVHIDSEEDYEAIDELRSLVNGQYSDDVHNPKLFRDRILIDKLNRLKNDDLTLYRIICTLSLKVKQKAKELKTDYMLLRKKKHQMGLLIAGIIGIIFTFPLFLYGNIFDLTFLGIPNLQIPKIRDIQFHSSIRYGISLCLALVFLPVFLIVCLIVFSPWWLALLIFVSLPLSGLFAVNYSLEFRRIIGGFRIRKYLKNNNTEYITLKKDHDELLNLISSLI
jgi:hypothetical protein